MCTATEGSMRDGVCVLLPVGSEIESCGNFACDGFDNDCPTACLGSNECKSGFYCTPSFKCEPGDGLGESCETDEFCASGFCVGGICCSDRCDEPCMACTAALKGSGEDGVCAPIAAGTDPLDQCNEVDPPDTCGRDGFCDGAGACREFSPTGTPCAEPTCSNGLVNAPQCNPAGECVPASVLCEPYVCADARDCRSDCQAQEDCEEGFVCVNEECLFADDDACSEDGSGVLGPGEVVLENCTPYRCQNARCRVQCSSNADCLPGYSCSSSNTCTQAAAASGGGDGGCGCRVASNDTQSVGWALSLLLVGLGWARRRRRLG